MASSPKSPSPRLLVADDDAPTRDLLTKLLEEAGYDVEAVKDGQEAVERVGRGGLDLVLLDVVMPRMSGLEACRIVKGMTRENFVPVVIVLPKTDTTSRVEGLAAGADDYVSKPFEKQDVVQRVAQMLRVKRVHDQMRAAKTLLDKVSVRDELTGLHNYRFLLNRLKESFHLAERHHDPLACAIFDVDRLRVYNDKAGRTFGDGVLRGVAQSIRGAVRESDAVVRYGADEFLLLLPATHFMGAVQVTERIWKEVGERLWSSSAGPCRVTVSVGIALFPSRDVRAKEDLLKCADLALASAKREGMNRICVFQQHGLLYTPHAAARAEGTWEIPGSGGEAP
jgi:diguanylate cyclase (GGDEF)-like protein